MDTGRGMYNRERLEKNSIYSTVCGSASLQCYNKARITRLNLYQVSNLRSGVLFSEERESIVTRGSEGLEKGVLFSRLTKA